MPIIKSSMSSRREFLGYLTRSGILLGCLGPVSCNVTGTTNSSSFRRYHISLQPEAWIDNSELLNILKNAGVSDIWMASFLQGRWYHTAKELRDAADYLISEGFNPHVLSVPLGHPGNALDPADEALSESKENWKNACTHHGELFSGTSIHPPVVQENIEAVKLLAEQGHDVLFLDDDFRLAKSPGLIGGCFCDDCKNEFLSSYDYGPADWELLIESVENRNPSSVLRSWIDHICEKEYAMFAALQNAAPDMEIGIMVMYLGAEKAGIALDDIFTFKKRIIPALKGIPFVEDNSPVVFAWYPTANKGVLWNVEEKQHTYTIVRDDQALHTVTVDALDVALIQDL